MHAERLELALEHIPASPLAKDEIPQGLRSEAEELLIETSKEDGLWDKGDWYYWCGDNDVSADVADQLWFWYHPDEYNGDLYEEKRQQANFDRPGVPEWMAEDIRREDGMTSVEETRSFMDEYHG